MDFQAFHAVLTGDVVGSRRLPAGERQHLLVVLRDAGQDLQSAFSPSIPFPPTIFRGDSWQFLSADPVASLRQGLYYRARVKAGMESNRVDTRFSLAIGKIDFLPPEGPAAGAGQAFNLSGQGLDEMDRHAYLRICFPPTFDSDLALALEAGGRLIDRLAQEWTDRQALAVSGALLDLTQARIAQTTFKGQVTQQAVAQHLASAGWPAILSGLEAFETIVSRRFRQ
ncbi:MAG: hypothetical protein PVG63_03145 [Anaerolineales bacterium]|jgi:hypothetical protein